MQDSATKTLSDAIAGKSFAAVGNDVVYLPEFKNSFNELFKQKVYTVNEISYCDLFSEPVLRYASTWAAKEAIYKAVKQLDNSALGFNAIEIIREKPAGKPTAILHGHEGEFDISLSITHDGDYVWAAAIVNSI